jgi:protein phosphatase
MERLVPGSRILLCSDGLSGMVTDPGLRDILAGESDPQVACTRMIDAANEAGGIDNITAVAIYIEAGSP